MVQRMLPQLLSLWWGLLFAFEVSNIFWTVFGPS